MPNNKQPGYAPVYGIRPPKPGMYLGLFHGRDTPHEAMNLNPAVTPSSASPMSALAVR
jgi:hypothetical protein